MFGIDDPNSSATMPTISNTVSSGWFQPGSFTGNIPATTLTVDWFNIVQAELLNVVTTAGLTPTKNTTTQVAQAISTLIKATPAKNYLYFSTPTALASNGTTFLGPSGPSTAAAGASWQMPVAGTITGVGVSSSAAPGGLTAIVATVLANGVATAAAATITSTNTTGSYVGNVAVAAGTTVSVQIVMSNGATTAYSRGWVAFTPS